MDTRRYLSIAEACEVFGVSRTTLYRLQKAGKLPVLHLGSRILIPIAAVEALEAAAISSIGLPSAEAL